MSDQLVYVKLPPRKTTIDPIYKKKLEAGNSTTTHPQLRLERKILTKHLELINKTTSPNGSS
jgi:hypothetical protein